MSSDWVYWGSGAAIGMAGLWLLIWALFADRSRGRRRCPKCWYNMSATESLRCPECGRTAKLESKLFKTRRRWRWAWACVLFFIGATFLAVQPTVRESGWVSIAPNTVLIAGFWTDDPTWAMEALADRTKDENAPLIMSGVMFLDSGKLWAWQWRVVIARCTEMLRRKDDPHGVQRSALQFLLYAAKSLARESDITAVFDTVERVAHEGNPELRRFAIAALSDDPVQQRAVDRVRRFLGDPDEDAKLGAGVALAMLTRKTDIALPLALETSQSSSETLRSHALIGLRLYAKRGGNAPEAVQAVQQAFADPETRSVAFRAYLSFSHLGEPAIEQICGRFLNSDAAERADVLRALEVECRSHPRALRVLLAALADESADVRQDACFYLEGLDEQDMRSLHTQLAEIATQTQFVEVRNAIQSAFEREQDEPKVDR